MKTSAVLLATALWAWAFASAAAAGWLGPDINTPHLGSFPNIVEHAAILAAGPSDGSWQEAAWRIVDQVGAIIAAGHKRAPVLVVIMSALLVLPVVALMSLTMHKAARLAKRDRRRPVSAEWTRRVGSSPNAPAWPAQAWLSIEGDAKASHPIAGEMVRIGRHPDNEVWLPDTSVHRYHAVIHRTEDADFFITDLSGEEGNGVRINGTRRASSQLVDGDVIELGKARMTFASIPI